MIAGDRQDVRNAELFHERCCGSKLLRASALRDVTAQHEQVGGKSAVSAMSAATTEGCSVPKCGSEI